MIGAHPLAWPTDWPRTHAAYRKTGRFSKGERKYSSSPGGSSWVKQRDVTVAEGVQRVLDELRRFGIDRDDVVVSTNVPTRLDGLPRSGAAEPMDPGAAVYWVEPSGARRVIAVDVYDRVADNLAALAATLDAMRAIERHGGARVLERAFTGFAALPNAAAELTWWEVLGCGPDATLASAQAAYRRAAAAAHPDRGGSHERMVAVNAAWAKARETCR